MEALGPKLRKQRRRLGLTLDDLSYRTDISKPYLSLIETGRVANPPSDEKLIRLEQTLGFPQGELLTQAHLHRTPRNVRAMLGKLIDGQSADSADHPPALPRLLREFADQNGSLPDALDTDAFAARVQGDDMAAKYRAGDIVIFAPSLPPRHGDDCFVRFKAGETTFKRVFFETDGQSPVIRLQPRNEKYRATVVKNEDLAGLYRAAYRYHRIDEDRE